MTRVVLICGTGASSSFLATKLLEKIQKKKLNITVSVSPESMLPEDIEDYDHILIGPHLVFLEEELSNKYQLKGTLTVIPYRIYGTMDGDQLLKLILKQQ